MNLQKYPDMQSIKKHPRHKTLIQSTALSSFESLRGNIRKESPSVSALSRKFTRQHKDESRKELLHISVNGRPPSLSPNLK